MSDEHEVDELLECIGWSRHTLARRLGVDSSTADAWAKGRRQQPAVLAWLRRLAAYHAEAHLPEGWTVQARRPGRPLRTDPVGS